MALRSAQFYEEAFKIVKEKYDKDFEGFREARMQLLVSFIVSPRSELKMMIQINFVDSPNPDDIVKNVCDSISAVQKQFNAVCRRVPDMNGREKDFHTLLKKYDEIFYWIWTSGDYSLDEVEESKTIKELLQNAGKKVSMALVGKNVSEN